MSKAKETAENTPKITKPPAQNKNLVIFIVLLFASIIAVLLYIQDLNQKQNQTFKQALTDIKKTSEQSINNTTQELSTLKNNFNQQHQELLAKVNKELQSIPKPGADWLLQKARYYLELANINNSWTSDYLTTENLLHGADATLSSVNNNAVNDIRKLIAAEELQVASANKLDTVKLLAQINAISQAVQELPIIPKEQQPAEQPISSSTTSTNWREHFQQSMANLQKLVIIRRNTDSSMHILSPNYFLVLRENLRLNLQQMSWAIIERDEAVFAISCKQALENLHYLQNNDQPQNLAIKNKLEPLQNVNLTVTKPQIGQALTALQKLIAESNRTEQG